MVGVEGFDDVNKREREREKEAEQDLGYTDAGCSDRFMGYLVSAITQHRIS